MTTKTRRQNVGKGLAEAMENQRYELVEVGRLKEHPQNPRRGNEQAIDESIEKNSWYGACVVQKSTQFILAGNHRYRVAKKRRAPYVPCLILDVDDQTAMRILLGDNRIADLGGYDEETLAACLDGLETLEGTGWGLPALEDLEDPEVPEPEQDDEVPDDVYQPSYGVIVVCEDEADQERIYEKLAGEGYQVRVVAV